MFADVRLAARYYARFALASIVGALTMFVMIVFAMPVGRLIYGSNAAVPGSYIALHVLAMIGVCLIIGRLFGIK
ncbi:hypothetical protein [Halegenticoccus tardaugens]|uniref:hypothetical protein n=1 Tax=Halegenticoccus tardaugens TaxID=2071624 RepID=UPI00100A8F1E|nr:hypothetical protein [Halegenticoccus tardaugens]